MSEISIEDFNKIDVKIGRIIEADRVIGSKKLVVLQIDIGGMKKQSVAGLANQYDIESLKDKLVVAVTNLKKKKILGLDAEVILLAAIDGPKISLLQPDKPFPNGSKIA